MKKVSLFLWVCLIAARVGAAENMIGNQSQNEGIQAVPSPGQVVIDGDLSEWDFSGRIWVFADKSVRETYSVQAGAMWDGDFLYLGARWRDPVPMFSAIDPQFNPSKGWCADSWQIRFQSDVIRHLTTWYYTAKESPTVTLSDRADGGGGDVLDLSEADGVRLAYVKDADGKGYCQEMRIPWRIIYGDVPEIKAGLVLRMGCEFLWGNSAGNWPGHRYADNMQPGVTSREFYWKNWKAWGDLVLLGTGNVVPRRYVADGEILQGSLPVMATLPVDATYFTLVIEDGQGRRVRNLAGDFLAENYATGVVDTGRQIEVLWDGLDDDGQLVSPGEYRVRGLSRKALGARYDMCFYNPGTPPWTTADGTGAWGSDHNNPLRVVRAGSMMIVSWPGAEGGSGIIGVAEAGRKAWGEKRGGKFIAADETYVYACNRDHNSGKEHLFRLAAGDGAYAPFVRPGQEVPFDYPLEHISPEFVTGNVTALAAGDGSVFLSTDSGKLVQIDAASAIHLKTWDVTGISALAVGGEGRLWAVVGRGVQGIDLATGKCTDLLTPGLVAPTALAVDPAGNIVVTDCGPDSQVKAYTPDGALAYTCGKKAGRPLRGAFDRQAMVKMTSVAVDAQGDVWVVESWQNPRRVSVWKPRDGSLRREYVGNSAYAGTGSYLREDEPDAAYVGALKLRLDREHRTYEVEEVLWVPDRARNEGFDLWVHAHWFSNPSFVKSSAGGREQTYLYANGMYGRWHGIFMRGADSWQPVAVITTVNELKLEIPALDLGDRDGKQLVFWNDANGDAAVALAECTFPDVRKPLGCGWGTRPGSDLSLYLFDGKGTVRYRPTGFTAAGAPLYGEAGMQPIALGTYPESVPLLEDDLVLNLGGHPVKGGHIQAFTGDGGRLLWQYPNPYPHVHGSHRATMPKPGLLIGPLKICGVAEINDTIGKVFLMRGNLGQDYLMTTDGLFVGAMFRDGRIPGVALPDSEAQVLPMAMERFSHGEPFSGWFGKLADGTIRMTCGFAREASMILDVTGLDSIRRFGAPAVTVTPADLAMAERENVAREAVSGPLETYVVARFPEAPDADAWQQAQEMEATCVGQPAAATIRLGWSMGALHARFEVSDPSPWLNQGKDVTSLFKTGDCVDIQLSPSGNSGGEPVEGDLRVVISQLDGKPVAVLMQPLCQGADESGKQDLQFAGARPPFSASQEGIASARVAVVKGDSGYTVEATVPWTELGMVPQPGMTLRGDCGFILSDAAGTVNTARIYWANKDTNLTSDMPSEAWLYPSRWGTLKLAE